MRSRPAIGQYEATLVLIVVSLSLASVVYDGLKSATRVSAQPVFINEETAIAGSPAMVLLAVNASAPTSITSLSVDAASSAGGILALGSGYTSTANYCAAGSTTFFSVYASQPGTLQVTGNGEAWISGRWWRSAQVSAGWQEVVISNATICSVILPGGQVISGQWSPSSVFVTGIPAQGSLSGIAFTFYLPAAGNHRVLITTTGGFDSAAI